MIVIKMLIVISGPVKESRSEGVMEWNRPTTTKKERMI